MVFRICDRIIARKYSRALVSSIFSVTKIIPHIATPIFVDRVSWAIHNLNVNTAAFDPVSAVFKYFHSMLLSLAI